MADLLELEGIAAGYGEALVLSGISLRLAEGETLALLGRNGTGKTTLIRTIVGLTRRRGRQDPARRTRSDAPAIRTSAPRPASAGCRRSAISSARSPWTRTSPPSCAGEHGTSPASMGFFRGSPSAGGNMGNQLSGGEQQMLAIGRALALNPRLLLLDEPLEGLAPIIVDELLGALRQIIREEGLAAILVEQSPRKILPLTQNAIILDRGRIAHYGPSAPLAADAAKLATLLGVEEERRGG